MEAKKVWKTNKNYKTIKEMDSICFPEDNPFLFGLPRYHWWFAYHDECPIAYAAGGKTKGYYFLARVGVLPEWRGKKIQKLLIKERIRKAIDLDVKGIYTYTSKDNEPSIKNLKSCGFKVWNNPPKSINEKDFIHWFLDIETARSLFDGV